jgi:hypothetical protein
MGFLGGLFRKNGPAPEVTFREREVKDGNTYEVYTASSRAKAMVFLRETEVKEERTYLIVETPEGNLGKDLIMIFNEGTSAKIEFGTRKPLGKLTKSRTHCTKCGYSVLPAGRPIPGATELIVLEELREGGVGFYCDRCATAWCPFCASSPDPQVCGLCGQKMSLLRE